MAIAVTDLVFEVPECPVLPDSLDAETSEQIATWRDSLVAALTKINIQLTTYNTLADEAGGKGNLPRDVRNAAGKFKRRGATLQKCIERDLRRLRAENRRRTHEEYLAKQERIRTRPDWRKMVGDLAEALRNDPAVSLATRHAASILARAIESVYAQQEGGQ